MIKIALYQPDIPQNVGAMMRLCACTGVSLDLIEPCGFPWDEKKIRKAAMDYIDHVDLTRHSSWATFKAAYPDRRILLMTSATPESSYIKHKFQSNDILLAGSESAGVPDEIHQTADARITIPMQAGLRSLNIVNATAMILGEALRQTDGF